MFQIDPTSCRRAYPPDASISYATMADGWRVRVFDWPVKGTARGSILFQTGRGDMIEKWLETLAHWHNAGWHVTGFDWRGQGGSGRMTDDPLIGHIDDFGTWTADLGAFWQDWVVRVPGPHILAGHSMGGHLALRGVMEGKASPKALILSAPMLGFTTSGIPVPIAASAIRLAAFFAPKRRAWPDNERPAKPGQLRQSFLTADEGRYADEMWWRAHSPDLMLGPPSVGWLSAAYASTLFTADTARLAAMTVPTLLLGTRGDHLVSPDAIERAAGSLPGARLLMFDESVGHEILREVDSVRHSALARIDAFLDEVALPA